jgi:molecular chaperone Hsp33
VQKISPILMEHYDLTPPVQNDLCLPFIIPGRNARGRLVRLGTVLDDILAKHDYPPLLARILAEALVLAGLFGSVLKDAGGQLTLQAQAEGGVIDLLVCDYRDGELRGYLSFNADKLAELPTQPSLFGLFGKGYLCITFDQAISGERYQGIVPLEGGSLAEAAENYFAQSEQIPSLIRLATAINSDGQHLAAGVMLQHLPEGEDGRERLHTRLDHPEWEHVAALATTVRADELVDPLLPFEQLLWRLFNEDEVRTLAITALSKGCRCNIAHIQEVLARFPAAEQAQMIDSDGLIGVDCAFCAKRFGISPAMPHA